MIGLLDWSTGCQKRSRAFRCGIADRARKTRLPRPGRPQPQPPSISTFRAQPDRGIAVSEPVTVLTGSTGVKAALRTCGTAATEVRWQVPAGNETRNSRLAGPARRSIGRDAANLASLPAHQRVFGGSSDGRLPAGEVCYPSGWQNTRTPCAFHAVISLVQQPPAAWLHSRPAAALPSLRRSLQSDWTGPNWKSFWAWMSSWRGARLRA